MCFRVKTLFVCCFSGAHFAANAVHNPEHTHRFQHDHMRFALVFCVYVKGLKTQIIYFSCELMLFWNSIGAFSCSNVLHTQWAFLLLELFLMQTVVGVAVCSFVISRFIGQRIVYEFVDLFNYITFKKSRDISIYSFNQFNYSLRVVLSTLIINLHEERRFLAVERTMKYQSAQ